MLPQRPAQTKTQHIVHPSESRSVAEAFHGEGSGGDDGHDGEEYFGGEDLVEECECESASCVEDFAANV